MIILDKNCGLDWELVALLEEAWELSEHKTLEDFVICAAVKEAGKVLAKTGDSGTGAEEQLDLFGGENQ